MATRRTNRQDFRGRSEFAGEVRSNTLPAKEAGAPISAAEEAFLIKNTGTTDITAELDRRAWLGFSPTPDSVIDFRD